MIGTTPGGGKRSGDAAAPGGDDDDGFGFACAQVGNQIEPVAAGHAQIHEDEIGPEFAGQDEGLVGITGFAHGPSPAQERAGNMASRGSMTMRPLAASRLATRNSG